MSERTWAEVAHKFRKIFGEDVTEEPISENNYHCIVCGQDTNPGKPRIEGVCITCTIEASYTPEYVQQIEANRAARRADLQRFAEWNAMSQGA